MRMNKRWFTAMGILSILGLTGCSGNQTTNGNQTTVANPATGANQASSNSVQDVASQSVGHTAPNFTLAKLDGSGQVALKDLLGKQPIILNAWASWCGPCQQETPDLESAEKQYGSQIQFVGVNMTSQEIGTSDAKDFVQKYHVSYPILTDPKASFFNAYGIIGLPTTFIISPAGQVIDSHVGGLSKSQIAQFVQEALKAAKA